MVRVLFIIQLCLLQMTKCGPQWVHLVPFCTLSELQISGGIVKNVRAPRARCTPVHVCAYTRVHVCVHIAHMHEGVPVLRIQNLVTL